MSRIIIPGQPHVLNRPRLSMNGGFAKVYDGQKQEKKVVIDSMRKNLENFLNPEAQLIVGLEFRFLPSKSDKEANLKLWEIDNRSSKDLDNMIKFYLDCGNEILWKDDRQIVKIYAEKKFTKNPCTIITIKEITSSLNDGIMDVFKHLSPEDLQNFVNDAHSIPPFNIEAFNMIPQRERHILMENIANHLISFSEKWTSRISKIKNRNKKIIRF